MQSNNKIILSDISEIFEWAKPVIYNIAYNFFKNKDVADDIVQDTMIKLSSYLPKEFPSIEKAQGWVARSASNLCKDLYRKNSSYKNMQTKLMSNDFSTDNSDNYSPEEIFHHNQVRTIINEVLSEYDPIEREIYSMYAFSAATLAEIQKKSHKKISRIRYIIEKVNKELINKAQKLDLI